MGTNNQLPKRVATGTLHKMQYTITQEDQMYRLNWNRTMNGKVENLQMWFADFQSAYNSLAIAVNQYVAQLIDTEESTTLTASESQALHHNLITLIKEKYNV
jgi:hypothetical protein